MKTTDSLDRKGEYLKGEIRKIAKADKSRLLIPCDVSKALEAKEIISEMDDVHENQISAKIEKIEKLINEQHYFCSCSSGRDKSVQKKRIAFWNSWKFSKSYA
jgi:hypothetical protein